MGQLPCDGLRAGERGFHGDGIPHVTIWTKNDLTGSAVWTLMKDGASQPLASFTEDGGTLALTETGKYTLTATLTDASVVFTETESPTYRYAGRSKAMAGLSALLVKIT